MKQWILLGLTIVGGYATYKWFLANKGKIAGIVAQPGSMVVSGVNSPISAPVDLAGIPSFDPTPVLNRPDMLYATMYNNPLSSVSGSPVYAPAFGPDANTGGLETW